MDFLIEERIDIIMKCIKQKYVSFVLIIAMLFLGMCYSNTQADSSLMYAKIHHTDSIINGSSDVEFPEQFSTESSRQIVIVYSSQYEETHRTNNSFSRKISCLLLIVHLLSQVFPFIFSQCFAGRFCHTLCTDVIVTYIHRKDGKKNS